jgi:hypothetical protein
MFLKWRGEVSHASVLLRVRCGQDSFVACRLASSVYAHAATSLHLAHSIIARVHFHYRKRMLETLVGVKECVVFNGYAYKTLAGNDPHSEVVIKRGKLFSVHPPWELCPNTCDAQHVCTTYPWGTYALVFADGSPQVTWRQHKWRWPPFGVPPPTNCLKETAGTYWADVSFIDADVGGGFLVPGDADVLLRRRLSH